mgnify:CR=1 FL=1
MLLIDVVWLREVEDTTRAEPNSDCFGRAIYIARVYVWFVFWFALLFFMVLLRTSCLVYFARVVLYVESQFFLLCVW